MISLGSSGVTCNNCCLSLTTVLLRSLHHRSSLAHVYKELPPLSSYSKLTLTSWIAVFIDPGVDRAGSGKDLMVLKGSSPLETYVI